VIALRDATDGALYGGKAAGLASCLRAGLPVPDGWALDWREALDPTASTIEAVLALGPVAIRSSALDEDGPSASFAGQHRTEVNVVGPEPVRRAIAQVAASARAPSALAYRARLGLSANPRMAVVVQPLVDADCAGVLFTRHPVTGADERVAEAAWGLGETVVAGVVTPDVYRWSRTGARLETRIGDKGVAIRPSPAGGCEEVVLAPERARARVLSDERLTALDDLAARCESTAGAAVDLEWAFLADRLYLLQSRPVTR
jgi:pyruvate,water dikinase